jgi:uncharacterized membrane protein
MAYYDILAIVIIVAFLILRFRFNFASRFIVVLALLILAVSAIASGTGDSGFANDLVIVAFYCLGVGVILLTYDLIHISRGPRNKEGPLYRSYHRIREFLNRLRS